LTKKKSEQSELAKNLTAKNHSYRQNWNDDMKIEGIQLNMNRLEKFDEINGSENNDNMDNENIDNENIDNENIENDIMAAAGPLLVVGTHGRVQQTILIRTVRDMDGYPVAERTGALHGPVTLSPPGTIDHAHVRLALAEQRHADGTILVGAGIIRRSVNRVDHPHERVSFVIAQILFLAQETTAGEQFPKPSGQEMLDRKVG